MNRRWFSGLLTLPAAVLLCLAGCSQLELEPPGVERVLLCQFRDGCRYATNGDQYWEEKDSAWNTYWLRLDDQNGRPEEIRFALTEDVERDVFAVDENYQMVWKRTLGSGRHSIPVTESMMGIIVPVLEGETFQPTGIGMHPQMETPLTGRRMSVLGDSVSAFVGFIPWEDYGYYSNINFGAASMWWAMLAEKTGMEICNINAVSSSGVTIPEDSPSDRLLAGNSDRCTNLASREGGAPDEIFVLLGGNDFLQQIPQDHVETEYLEMLSKIKKSYPDARIHVCTYFQSPSFPLERLEELNGLLRTIAEKAEVGVIDFQDCGILGNEPQTYLIDGMLHPNERGQILMGISAARQLLEGEMDP